MDKNRIDNALETTQEDLQDKDNDVRTLQDLELVLVGGGGDDIVTW